MAGQSKIVSFSIDEDLLSEFDGWIADEGFPSRSAGLQRLVREELASARDRALPGPAMATVSYVYDHHQRELLDRLTHLQHQHLDLVVSTTHVHLDHSRCLEVLILRGEGAEVSALARAMGSTRGVERARISILPVAPSAPHHDHAHGGPSWHTSAHAHDHDHHHHGPEESGPGD